MKILIGGEVETDVYDFFRVARNSVLDKLESIKLEIDEVAQISFCIFLLKNFETNTRNRYSKKYKRIEIEVIIEYELFKESDDVKKVKIIEDKIKEAIKNYKNKSIETISMDKINDQINEVLK